MEAAERKYFTFRGVKLNNLNYDDICKILTQERGRKGFIWFIDTNIALRAGNDPELKKIINSSLINIVDGMPLAWFGWLSGCKNLERISAPDFFARRLEEPSGLSHFLLGDTEETIGRIMAKARERNPSISIQGYSPPFRDHFTSQDNRIMLERIEAADPDLIWVSFGSLKQEPWVYSQVDKLRRGHMITVGAAFRYYIGEIYTPPVIVQRMGLQWLLRTIEHKDPNRNLPHRLFHQFMKLSKYLFYLPGELTRNRREAKELHSGIRYTMENRDDQ
jgi:N-acetylglucosaminyldiphosphoundecaprenol N-acetyl-beta-D-mannosaminyltransferase